MSDLYPWFRAVTDASLGQGDLLRGWRFGLVCGTFLPR
jgi:hypothetical protein